MSMYVGSTLQVLSFLVLISMSREWWTLCLTKTRLVPKRWRESFSEAPIQTCDEQWRIRNFECVQYLGLHTLRILKVSRIVCWISCGTVLTRTSWQGPSDIDYHPSYDSDLRTTTF
jgi:hypothetical protein